MDDRLEKYVKNNKYQGRIERRGHETLRYLNLYCY